MSEQEVKIKTLHGDCLNYCSMDVAKGICRLKNMIVPIDGDSCEDYQVLPKCKFCQNYKAGEEVGIGNCLAEAHKPWAYPEMIAVTCEWYKAI